MLSYTDMTLDPNAITEDGGTMSGRHVAATCISICVGIVALLALEYWLGLI